METARNSDTYGFYDYPANRITFPIHSTSKLMIEPEIGFYQRKEKQDNDLYRGVQVGLGLNRLYLKNKLTIYPGIKTGINWNTRVNNIGEEFETMFRYTTISIGPVIGAEYFFGERFSLGGEIGLKYASKKIHREPEEDDEEENDVFWFTDTGVRLRFYFGE